MTTHEAKRILCFGDSNTWGYEAVTKKRFGPDVRWTGVMQRALGSEYEVIEAGLNARTTVWDDPIEGNKNGARHLLPCLESHRPLDLVILMLGTNDLKLRFSVTPSDIADSLEALGEIVLQSGAGRDGGAPKLLIVSPIHIEALADARQACMFGPDAQQRSRELWAWVQTIAANLGAPCFDASSVAKADAREGLHISREGHQTLGQALCREARAIIG